MTNKNLQHGLCLAVIMSVQCYVWNIWNSVSCPCGTITMPCVVTFHTDTKSTLYIVGYSIVDDVLWVVKGGRQLSLSSMILRSKPLSLTLKVPRLVSSMLPTVNGTFLVASTVETHSITICFLKLPNLYTVAKVFCLKPKAAFSRLYNVLSITWRWFFFFISFCDFSESAEAVVQRFFNKFQDEWFQYCDEELLKINTFFAGTEFSTIYREFSAIYRERWGKGNGRGL